ncbi:MAG: DUF5698 domain-containing protein [Pseudomonadota bacterium]
MDLEILLTGIGILLARVIDVSLGTIRTISIVHGRTRVAFLLGFVEVSVWLAVISTVVRQIGSEPVLGIFYALGFSLGNVIGIMLERRIAFGYTILRVISPGHGKAMAEQIRSSGFAVTTFEGEGKSGPVTELYVVCRRRDMDDLVRQVRDIEPDAFYITEQAGSVSKMYRPSLQPSWRSVLKIK